MAHRTVSPSDEVLEELGKEIVAWVTDDPKKEKIHLTQWFYGVKDFSPNEYQTIRKREVFARYYAKAKALMAIRYIDGTVNPSIAHRFLRIYFPEIKREETEMFAFKADLARRNQQDDDDNLIEKLTKALRDCEEESESEEPGEVQVEVE
jgi:hypothetical protein